MVAISQPWYNGSYTMAAKPIKSLELHYTMIQLLIVNNIVQITLVLRSTNVGALMFSTVSQSSSASMVFNVECNMSCKWCNGQS